MCTGYLGNAIYINPYDDITCCTEITNRDDDCFEEFKIGNILDDKIIFNENSTNITNLSAEKCKNCILEYICNSCVVRYMRELKNDEENYTCKIKKEFALKELINICYNQTNKFNYTELDVYKMKNIDKILIFKE